MVSFWLFVGTLPIPSENTSSALYVTPPNYDRLWRSVARELSATHPVNLHSSSMDGTTEMSQIQVFWRLLPMP